MREHANVMSWSQLKTVLMISSLISIYGISVLVVWLLGPSVGLSIILQIALTALILLTLPIGLLIHYYRKKRARQADKASPKEKRNAGERARQLPAPTGTYEELSRGAEEVVQWLRATKLTGVRSNDAVFALPWFMVTGPSASGKTSLLLSSGLDFHALPSQRAADQNLVRATNNCDWRVTDSAIFIDTAGRYQSDGRDRDEWAALLETVKSHRKTRPLDGFIIAVNAAAVLGLNDIQVEQQAKIIRARLDEAVQRMQARFPVYLVFTHMDAIEGFADFFRAFSLEERAQVWGVTVPLSQEKNAHSLFDEQFDHLYGRLLRRRTVQLSTLASSSEQLRSLKFPGRFRRARKRLGHFTTALFRPNPFSDSPLLRGFYFASSGQSAMGGRHSHGEEYFTRNFFSEVLLRDKDIVAASHAQRRKPYFKQIAVTACAAAVMLTLFGGMVVSFFSNRQLIANARVRGQELMKVRQEAIRDSGTPATDARQLEAIENVRSILDELETYDRESPPLSHRFGLYSGGNLNAQDSMLRHIYFEAIDEKFLKPTVSHVEADLEAFASTSDAQRADNSKQENAAKEEDLLGRHYDLLKAYLMLVNPDKVEPTFLNNTLRDYWKDVATSGTEEDAAKQLEFFASQVDRADAPHPEINTQLVARVQNRLIAYPIVNRVYKRITAEINAAVKYPVNLTTIAGARDGNILVGTYSVPGSFTTEGYSKLMEKLESSAVDEFRKDDWVMKGTETTDQNFDVRKDELAGMYYRDYVAHWQKFLQEIKVRDYQSKEDAVRALRILASSNSPLEKVAREVGRQTNLSAATRSGLLARLQGLFRNHPQADGAANQVEKEFRPLIAFLSDKDTSPMTEYRAKLKSAGDQLGANPKSQGEIAKALQSGNDTIGLRSSRQAIADLIEASGFSAAPASDAAAKLLKQPLDNLNVLLVGTDFEQIDKAWQQLYLRSWQPLEARFPFSDGPEDASITALASFLNPDKGELTRFFNERLKPYFEDDWSPRKEVADKFSPEFISFLKNARRLRDNLFPAGGSQPNVEYQLALAQPVRNAMLKLEIDGNVLEPDKPTPPFRWPGNKSGVKITIVPTSGPNTGQTQDLTQGKPFTGEWGLLRMFVSNGGGADQNSQSQLNVNGLRLTIQPMSGNVFQRELFTSVRAPKSAL
jgi:type VI secretion system protein ImpL